jgi:hypothetical protein
MPTQSIKIKNVATPPRIAIPTIRIPRKWLLSASVAFTTYYPKVRANAFRILIGILVFDLVLGLYVVAKVFAPPLSKNHMTTGTLLRPLVPSRVVPPPTLEEMTGATHRIATTLQEQGYTMTALGEVQKSGFSHAGTLLGVEGENIMVFEYGTHHAAFKEAEAAALKTSENTKRNAWSARANIYVKDSLVIYYLGANEQLASSLELYAGTKL